MFHFFQNFLYFHVSFVFAKYLPFLWIMLFSQLTIIHISMRSVSFCFIFKVLFQINRFPIMFWICWTNMCIISLSKARMSSVFFVESKVQDFIAHIFILHLMMTLKFLLHSLLLLYFISFVVFKSLFGYFKCILSLTRNDLWGKCWCCWIWCKIYSVCFLPSSFSRFIFIFVLLSTSVFIARIVRNLITTGSVLELWYIAGLSMSIAAFAFILLIGHSS